MNIVTGYRGEPHITSSQDRAQNQGAFGTGSCILGVGQKLQAQIVSANEIRIRDGAISHQGCVGVIEKGTYDTLTIANGSQGMKRSDLIVARYTKDAGSSVESISLVVIQGTAAASNPADPSYNSGDIQSGDSPVDMPLYRVNIDGVTITDTTPIAPTLETQKAVFSAPDGVTSASTAAEVIDAAEENVHYIWSVYAAQSYSPISTGSQWRYELFRSSTGQNYSLFKATRLNTGDEYIYSYVAGSWYPHFTDSNMFQTKEYSYDYSNLAAGGRLNVTGTNFGVATPSGYVPIGVVYYTTGSQNAFALTVNSGATGSGQVMSIKNTGSSAISGTANITILYCKSGMGV